MDSQKQKYYGSHVLIFPLPVQGHLNSMLKLAQLLCLANLKVTFLTTDYNYRRLTRYADDDIQTRFAGYPSFRFETIPDGLPEDHPRSGDFITELFRSLNLTVKPLLREILMGTRDDLKAPVTCFIVDGILGFTYEVGQQVGVPVIAFRTISACCFWAFFCIPRLIQDGQIPFKDDGDNSLDEIIQTVPGMETFLRRRDLPGVCRTKDLSDPTLQLLSNETARTKQARSLILNTLEDLEGPILSLIRANCCPNIYSIGPLHAHLKRRFQQHHDVIDDDNNNNSPNMINFPNSLWEVDRTCIQWLDDKPTQSVVYVSFGSITTLTRTQLMEFWAGLVHSNKPFLWVIRPDSVRGGTDDHHHPPVPPDELLEETKQRGCIVSWAPQEEVLAHRAVGGFLTHSGWNSTLESIVAGVPMACWPYFADQQINSRYVSEVWKIGLDIKDRCDRQTVEMVVRDLMEGKRDELVRSMAHVSQSVHTNVTPGGSSHHNLDRLIQDIRSMAGEAPSTSSRPP